MTSLSKNKIKYIRSMEQKKARKEHGTFLAEGPKLTGELLGRFPCRLLVATEEWLNKHPEAKAEEIVEASPDELSRASLLKTPQQVLGVFAQPSYELDLNAVRTSLSLALDGVQDPGNLGTIVRLADWFGINDIICSPDTADIYNPKTVQATMGGIARVRVHYADLPAFIRSVNGTPVYGTFLDGENLYTQPLSESGLVIMGNEGKGVRPEVETLIDRRLYIPNYPRGRETAESLNVAIATAVVCAEFRRRAAWR